MIKLGIVMDPIANINIKKDSSFAMLLEAQRRGYELHYMERHIPMYHAMFRQKARIIILTHPIFIARLPFMYLMPITGA